MRQRILTLLSLLIASVGTAFSADAPVDARLHAVVARTAPAAIQKYRFPEVADLTGDWAEYSGSWRADADFTGDGLRDSAILLPRSNGIGFQLIVVLSSAAETPTVVSLLEADGAAQTMGLGVVAPGRYRTAVGKGYDFGPDNQDPDEIEVVSAAINHYRFESVSVFWYWDADSTQFRSVQLSD